jgi:hypothetical protein
MVGGVLSAWRLDIFGWVDRDPSGACLRVRSGLTGDEYASQIFLAASLHTPNLTEHVFDFFGFDLVLDSVGVSRFA